jgi:tetratricopeptide (TPR) repeat protein
VADPRAAGAERRRGHGYGAGVAVIAVAWVAMLACAIPMLGERKVRQSQEFIRDRRPDKAMEAANTAVKLAPWAARPKIQAALVRQWLKQPTPALQDARDAVELEPANWRNWLVLADIQQWAQQTTNYDQSIRKALALNPRSKMLRQRVNELPSSQAAR